MLFSWPAFDGLYSKKENVIIPNTRRLPQNRKINSQQENQFFKIAKISSRKTQKTAHSQN